MWRIVQADILEWTKGRPEEFVDGVFCDPPYELGFMGKDWDKSDISFNPKTWIGIKRLMKPGAFLLAFGGTRTFHRLTCAIEDAGFEIRDCVMWIYGSGFPKSLDVGKAIDKAAGVEREVEVIGLWDGWGTALKPAWEPIIVAMKPFDGTFAENALKHGVAGLNVDGSRIHSKVAHSERRSSVRGASMYFGLAVKQESERHNPKGRWPANVIHDGSEEVVGEFPVTVSGGPMKMGTGGGNFFSHSRRNKDSEQHDNGGSAARFFYCAKASKKERGEGNDHPTVKPIDLCRYLASLILSPKRETPRRLLVPFAGSGSEMIGALLVGWEEVVGVEKEESYIRIAKSRLKKMALITHKSKEKKK